LTARKPISSLEARRNDRAARRPRGAESEERWQEIITAAGEIFYEKGYEATSLQDIASAVGLLKGSVYYYIKTKEDLLYELVTRAQALWASTLVEDEKAGPAPAPDRLRAFIRRWMALTAEERKWSMVAEREFTRLTPRRLKTVIENRDRFSAFVKDIIRQGVDDGSFDPDVEVSVATVAVFELMKSSHLWHRASGPLSMYDIGDWYATFVIRGLGGPSWAAEEASAASAS
jgi:AcrR family transcriptional regulator